MSHATALLLLALFTVGSAMPAARSNSRVTSDLSAPLRDVDMCGAGLPGDTHFTIAATGDTFPHENIQAVGEAQGYDSLFDLVRPFLHAADLGYTNFDGAMLEGAGYTGYPNFNYNPKLATALHNAGIGLVSTANNHILDRGPEGLDATMQVLTQNGIAFHGTVPTSAAKERPAFLRLPLSHNGVSISVGFVSATWGTNGIADPYNQVNLLYGSNAYGAQGGVRQQVLDAVAQARRETDLVVVAAHWGFEYQFAPDQSQIDAAQALAAAGADIILGAQPHTLQPVDMLDTNGRKTLVIYSLANFLASQGAFQDQYYSATATIFYIGAVREADGRVRVTGYRYLPIIHVDADTRPAPIPAQGYEDVIAHVRTMMRDPAGLRQLDPDPAALAGEVEICPALDVGGQRVGGDFASFYRTLGGERPVEPTVAQAILGVPRGEVVQEPSGDCGAATSVLYTPFFRLELHPEAAWPYRVVGSQLGADVYAQRYGAETLVRGDPASIASEPMRAFFERYGGQVVFGLPIGGTIDENGTTVQYFERARLELVPGAEADAPLLNQVQLGRLSEAYRGIAVVCGLAVSATAPPVATTAGAVTAEATAPPAATGTQRPPFPWGWLLPGLVFSLGLGLFVGWLFFERVGAPRARERVLGRNKQAAGARPVPPANDDDVLQELLGLKK